MVNEKLPSIWFGGDYNPDQWDEKVWLDDIEMMKRQHVNVVTLPVFSWAHLQPSEDEFDFDWLDRIINLLYENGIHVILATPTAAQPAWMSFKYPEILPTDISGRKKHHGARNNFCPNSREYRRLSAGIAEKMAIHYKDNPAIVMWHINNEYGTKCYCEHCSEAFREWLRNRYSTLENLNKCWNTRFWSHTYYAWEEIEAPSYLNEMVYDGNAGRDITFFPAMAIDYDRFMSESLQGCFENEKAVIRKHMPDIPITTNIMAPFKSLDLNSWSRSLDVIGWDCYPSNEEITDKDLASILAFKFDLMRGVGKGKPFLLMEQTPSQQNWLAYNSQKRPGIMRLWSYQAIAHGSESVLFFQWRQSQSGFEKYHAAMVPHAGHLDTRVCRELTTLGKELDSLKNELLDARTDSRVAIVFDWPNWWTVEYSSGPSVALKYQNEVISYYKALHKHNIPVDIIGVDSDLSQYDIIIAPVLCMAGNEFPDKCKKAVASGKTFITTFFSGLVDDNDKVILGGYPGAFRDLLGIWVEETDALLPSQKNSIINCYTGSKYECGMICDVVHSEGSEVLATFAEDYYAETPCITENSYGKGKAIYIATKPEDKCIEDILMYYCNQYGIKAPLKAPKGVEVIKRTKGNTGLYFILNNTEHVEEIDLKNLREVQPLIGEYSQNMKLKEHDVLIFKALDKAK